MIILKRPANKDDVNYFLTKNKIKVSRGTTTYTNGDIRGERG